MNAGTKPNVEELVEALAALDEGERLELCDALVDDPRLRDLLEAIDDFLYLEKRRNAAYQLARAGAELKTAGRFTGLRLRYTR